MTYRAKCPRVLGRIHLRFRSELTNQPDATVVSGKAGANKQSHLLSNAMASRWPAVRATNLEVPRICRGGPSRADRRETLL